MIFDGKAPLIQTSSKDIIKPMGKRHAVRPHIDERIFRAVSRHAEQGFLPGRNVELFSANMAAKGSRPRISC